MEREALERAVTLTGGQTALAKAIGVRQSHIWNWLNREGRVPAERVIAVEQATEGRVSRSDLRPDLYPQEAA